MTSTEQVKMAERTAHVIESVRQTTEPALEAVRDFMDTVNDVFPDLGEDGPRRKIIDSAFEMTEKLVGLSTRFAEQVVKESGTAPKVAKN